MIAPDCPARAAHDLILRASAVPAPVQLCILRRYGTADTITIRDQVRRALLDDTIGEAVVDLVLSAERERRRSVRSAA